MICLGMHRNVMLCFMVQAFQDSPLCSSTLYIFRPSAGRKRPQMRATMTACPGRPSTRPRPPPPTTRSPAATPTGQASKWRQRWAAAAGSATRCLTGSTACPSTTPWRRPWSCGTGRTTFRPVHPASSSRPSRRISRYSRSGTWATTAGSTTCSTQTQLHRWRITPVSVVINVFTSKKTLEYVLSSF